MDQDKICIKSENQLGFINKSDKTILYNSERKGNTPPPLEITSSEMRSEDNLVLYMVAQGRYLCLIKQVQKQLGCHKYN